MRIWKSSGHGISNLAPIGTVQIGLSELHKSCFGIGMKNLHASKVDSKTLKHNARSRSPDSSHHGIVAAKVKGIAYGWYESIGMVASDAGL